MNIPLNATVYCTDGKHGHTTCLIINPISQVVSHVVVQTKWGALEHDRLVPIKDITESSADSIHVSLTKDELNRLEQFTIANYISSDLTDEWRSSRSGSTDYVYGGAGTYMTVPYTTAVEEAYEYDGEAEQMPYGELGIHRGADVEAIDGRVGRVDEFIVNPENNHISHLIMREGHLWGARDVTIPISNISKINSDTVKLNLDKAAVKQLPAMSVKRWWQ